MCIRDSRFAWLPARGPGVSLVRQANREYVLGNALLSTEFQLVTRCGDFCNLIGLVFGIIDVP